jgi:signal transduction histidine kinase
MASEAGRHQRQVAVAALVLATCSAGLVAAWGSPRLAVAASLGMALAAVWGAAALRRLGAPAPAPQPPAPPPAPDALLRLEATLEHLPVAVWRVEADGRVRPLTLAAHRLLAPGGAAQPEALRALLAEPAPEGRQVISFDSEQGAARAVLARSSLQLGEERARLVALQPIEAELRGETLQAWQALVRVLTHEIMNSLTPISSLAQTALSLNGDDLHDALSAIARRAAHLQDFVARYRSVSQWPAPQAVVVPLAAVFAHVEQLVRPDWQAAGGTVSFQVEPLSLSVRTDPAQLEQVLINLAKNALEACAAQPAPSLMVQADLARGGRLRIQVSDNGPGVAEGLEQQIFTPFFTTRPGGSGIGLAVVQALLQGLGGTVRYAKRPGGGACFVLGF